MNFRGTSIGEVGDGLQTKTEIKANAKLIAAAPELLDILSRILNHEDKIHDLKVGTGDIVAHAVKTTELYEEA